MPDIDNIMADNAPQIIAADSYPQMTGRQHAARLAQSLRTAATSARTAQIFADQAPVLRAAVLDYVGALKNTGGDHAAIADLIHEIHGFAETAGFAVAGHICESLCRYMEESERTARPLDDAIIALHVNAVIRATGGGQGEDDLSGTVAAELAALVTRRLATP